MPPDAGGAGEARGGRVASDLFLRILLAPVAHGDTEATLEYGFQVVWIVEPAEFRYLPYWIIRAP